MKKQFICISLVVTFLLGCSSKQSQDSEPYSSTSQQSSEETYLSRSASHDKREYSNSENQSSAEQSSSSAEEAATSQKLTWSSPEEAVSFYENTLIEQIGPELASIELNGEFYDREGWELIDNTGDTIVLSLPNLGRGGKRAVEFVRGEVYTEITFFEYDIPYPEQPSLRWTVRNSDFVIVEEEDLNPTVAAIEPFTAENAFVFLKEQEGFTADLFLDYSTHDPESNYYELVIASETLQAQGGSGTVGIYHIYEDGTIVDTYSESTTHD